MQHSSPQGVCHLCCMVMLDWYWEHGAAECQRALPLTACMVDSAACCGCWLLRMHLAG